MGIGDPPLSYGVMEKMIMRAYCEYDEELSSLPNLDESKPVIYYTFSHRC